jgi:hypothetical protein
MQSRWEVLKSVWGNLLPNCTLLFLLLSRLSLVTRNFLAGAAGKRVHQISTERLPAVCGTNRIGHARGTRS